MLYSRTLRQPSAVLASTTGYFIDRKSPIILVALHSEIVLWSEKESNHPSQEDDDEPLILRGKYPTFAVPAACACIRSQSHLHPDSVFFVTQSSTFSILRWSQDAQQFVKLFQSCLSPLTPSAFPSAGRVQCIARERLDRGKAVVLVQAWSDCVHGVWVELVQENAVVDVRAAAVISFVLSFFLTYLLSFSVLVCVKVCLCRDMVWIISSHAHLTYE